MFLEPSLWKKQPKVKKAVGKSGEDERGRWYTHRKSGGPQASSTPDEPWKRIKLSPADRIEVTSLFFSTAMEPDVQEKFQLPLTTISVGSG
jgi:hypothetical protein